jgi:hypothetical protein
MIENIVSKLEQMGLFVAAIVCDQESSHRSCLTDLNVTTAKPSFQSVSGRTVYVLHDPPHLIKNVRNNLLTYDFVIDNKTISFKHIEQLYDVDCKNVLRFVPKLTKGHIELNNFKKMNVKLATQVLSHSVASGIRCYIKLKQMAPEAEATADFVEKINRLFDIMNSNSFHAKNKWQKPLSSKTLEQFHELRSAVPWIEEWKFKSRRKNILKVNLPFKQGLLMSITALLGVCSDLINVHGFKYVMTSRFNQDVVENWFSCVRGKGRNNDSRTTLEYESASKSITVNWLLEHPERGSNCELDCDSFVGLLSQVEQPKNEDDLLVTCATADSNTVSDFACSTDNIQSPNSCNLSSDWSQIFCLNDVDSNVVFYIAGYLTRKLSTSGSCNDCMVSYIKSKELHKLDSSKHTVLMEMRQFDWAKYGLVCPSAQLYDLCRAVEQIVQLNMEAVIAGPRVMGNLKEIVSRAISVNSYPIDSCCHDHRLFWLSNAITLYLRIRIHHFVRVRNRELKDLANAKKIKQLSEKTASKPSRKTKKIKHL